MKVLLIADIHSNMVALREVLRDAGAVDMTLHAGDIVDYNPWPNQAIGEVRRLGLRSVMGNHDRDAAQGTPIGYNPYAVVSCLWTYRLLTDEGKRYLLGLPASLRIRLGGLEAFICHGSPRDLIDEYVTPDYPRRALEGFLAETGADILILGHTHIPILEELSGKRYVLNPGSVGQPRDGDPRASYMILTLDGADIAKVQHRRVVYDVEAVASEVARVGLPSFLGERLRLGV